MTTPKEICARLARALQESFQGYGDQETETSIEDYVPVINELMVTMGDYGIYFIYQQTYRYMEVDEPTWDFLVTSCVTDEGDNEDTKKAIYESFSSIISSIDEIGADDRKSFYKRLVTCINKADVGITLSFRNVSSGELESVDDRMFTLRIVKSSIKTPPKKHHVRKNNKRPRPPTPPESESESSEEELLVAEI